LNNFWTVVTGHWMVDGCDPRQSTSESKSSPSL
jgi:hypothetical protein